MKNNGKIINKLFRNSVISIIAAAVATMPVYGVQRHSGYGRSDYMCAASGSGQ